MTIPREWRTRNTMEQQAFDEWGAVNGMQHCADTLREQILHGGPDFLIIHKRIRIVDRAGNQLKRLDEKSLNLEGALLHTEEQDDCYIVTMKKKPNEKAYYFKRAQPLDQAQDLTVYFKYKNG